MKRKWFGLAALCLCALSLLAACAGKREQGETTRAFMYRTGINGLSSISDNGILSFYYPTSALVYLDFATGQEIYLCGKEGCTHEDYSCNASIASINGKYGFFYNGMLYIVAGGGLNHTDIWQAERDGSSRKQIIEGIEMGTPDGNALVGNTLYITGTYMKETQAGENVAAAKSYGVLYACNLDEHSAELVVSLDSYVTGAGFTYMEAVGDQIYYAVSEFTEDMSEIFADPDYDSEALYEKLEEVQSHVQICVYDPAEGTTEYIYDETTPALVSTGPLGISEEFGILLYHGEKGLVWFRDGEEILLCPWSETLNSNMSYWLCGDRILVINEDAEIYLLDAATGEQLTQPQQFFEEEQRFHLGQLGYYDGKMYLNTGIADIVSIDVQKLEDGDEALQK